MKRFILVLMATLVAMITAGRTQAHETDPFTLPEGRTFADIGPELNEWVFGVLERAVNKVNQRIDQARSGTSISGTLATLQSPEEIIRAVNTEFGNAYVVIEGWEARLNSRALKQRYPGKVVGYKQQFGNIFQHVHFILDPRQVFRLWHASTFMAYGAYIGTDKIGHFTDMGMNYYRAYSAARKRGMNEEDAVKAAIEVGTDGPLFGEKGMVGFLSAGHYSNADLAANYLGFVFYRSLVEPVVLKGRAQPPLLELKDDRWEIASHVRRDSNFFELYVSDHLDEALNPGLFESAMRDAVRKAIQERATRVLNRRCDQHGNHRPASFFDAVKNDLKTYYGQPYGHAGRDDELISLASVCYPTLPADASHTDRTYAGMTPLHLAAMSGDLNTVKRLIQSGANVNVPVRSSESYSPEWGNTPLHYAARDGRLDVVRHLLTAGANLNARNDRGQSPLHRALAYRDIVEELIKRGASVTVADSLGNTALHWAAVDGQAEAIDVLLTAGAKARDRNTIGFTPLHFAAMSGSTSAATTLLAYGAEVNAKSDLGITPLHVAVAHDRLAFAELLLKNRAAVGAADQFGWTALHEAAHRGSPDLIEYLLRNGAQASQQTVHGNSPLHIAARRDDTRIVELLLQHRADVHAINRLGMSALHEAALADSRRVASLLMRHGAQTLVRDKAGKTPIKLASEGKNNAMLAVLRSDVVDANTKAISQ